MMTLKYMERDRGSMGQKEVYDLLSKNDWMTAREIYEQLPISSTSIHASLRRLVKSGYVTCRAKLVVRGNRIREYKVIQ